MITKDDAYEIKAAIEAAMETLKEYGVHVKAQGMYFNEDSFYISLQGVTNPSKPFEAKAKRELIF